ncbi:armadillo-type protein [Polychytrium aggregatum]|uniref:armadillo-type protein n=1 Tax=Polychytrium aggregatum TaxID=110093 RepID=UPI0022FE51E9|nr:armadillo-type protein [Polychytrium aggregatum]KAI9201935.1 armadillo-type protein [Polychytrium aggregatum]
MVDSKIEYLMAFMKAFGSVTTQRPEKLPSLEFIYDIAERNNSSPKPRNNSQRGASRAGSVAENRNNPPKTSQERYLESLEGKKTVGVAGVMSSIASQKGGAGWQPSPQRTNSQRGGKLGGRNNSGKNARAPSQKDLLAQQAAANLPPVKPLEKSDNAWSSTLGQKHEVSQEDEEAFCAQLSKKARSILNKLTPEKFDKLARQMVELELTSPTFLKSVIELIFEKAVDEPSFGGLYANLCLFMSAELPKVQSWVSSEGKNNHFRRALLNTCQEEFESGKKWTQEDAASEAEMIKNLPNMTAEEKEAYALAKFERSKVKRRVLGNIIFIGELFKLNMITEKIMHSCVNQLLRDVRDPEEEETESLCKLMATIGSRLDHEKAQQHIDLYFSRIAELSKNQKLPSRIRFMLQDLIELRQNKWKARQEASGPKKISEIRAEIERKQQQEEEERRQRELSQRSRGSQSGRHTLPTRADQFDKRRGGDGRGSMRDGRSGPIGDGWSTVGRNSGGGPGASGSSNTQAGDLNMFGSLQSSTTKRDRKSIVLGPSGSSGKWSMGAGTSASAKSRQGLQQQEKEEPSRAPTNMFDLLGDSSDKKHDDKHADSPAASTPASSAKSAAAPAATPTEEKAISPGMAKRKIENMLAEWWSLGDVSEVVATIKEMKTEAYHVDAVYAFVEGVMEKKLDQLKKTVSMLVNVFKQGVVRSEHLRDAIVKYSEVLEDVAIDVPSVYKFTGILIARLLAAEAFVLSDLETLLSNLLASPSRKPPAVVILGEIIEDFKSNDQLQGLQGLVDAEPEWNYKAIWPANRAAEAKVFITDRGLNLRDD